jgi:Ca2+-binding RTX toxin-like protein
MRTIGRQRIVRKTILLVVCLTTAMILGSGTALAATKQCEPFVRCYGTKESDTLLGTKESDVLLGKGADDTLRGFGETDALQGHKGGDKVFGGPGSDHLNGGFGDDVLIGGASCDSYEIYVNNWGSDQILDTGSYSQSCHSNQGVSLFTAYSRGLTIDLVSSPSKPEVTSASGRNTINWPYDVIGNVQSNNPGNDHINGNSQANFVTAWTGNDTVTTKEGNDFVNVADVAGGDIVDCGGNVGGDATSPDNDFVLYDRDDTLYNCEQSALG